MQLVAQSNLETCRNSLKREYQRTEVYTTGTAVVVVVDAGRCLFLAGTQECHRHDKAILPTRTTRAGHKETSALKEMTVQTQVQIAPPALPSVLEKSVLAHGKGVDKPSKLPLRSTFLFPDRLLVSNHTMGQKYSCPFLLAEALKFYMIKTDIFSITKPT